MRYRRALMLMTMTLVVPGSAQLAAGNRQVGQVALRIWLVLVAFAVASIPIGLVNHQYVFWLASDTALLQLLRFVLMVLAVGWAALLVDAWRLGQPLTLSLTHRRAVVGVNGVLCLSVAGTLLFGAHLVGVQRDFILTMFAGDEVTAAHHGRFNVLLLGGDSGAGRWGLRPDSMTVASIDEETGRTVLVGLPRNMAGFPFAKGSVMAKQFPKGFDCEGCYLNGVSTWAEDHTSLFGKSEHPGVDATIMAIEGITGLKINYWAMVNLQGFRDLVDAVGGVTLNVRQPIPVGGLGSDVTGYIEPGVRKLDGHDVLWFARARDGSDDYSRMARQKCVMGAMLRQISPQTARQELRGDRQRVVGDDLDQHPSGRGRPLHLPGPRRTRPEDLHRLAGAADDRHRRPRHPHRAADGQRRHRPRRGPHAGQATRDHVGRPRRDLGRRRR